MQSPLDAEVLLETFPHSLNAEEHCHRNILQETTRSLIDRYIEGEFGLEVDFRSRYVIGDLEIRDFAIVFENSADAKVTIFEGHSGRHADSQVTFCGSGTNDMQSAVPVNSGPVIEDRQALTDVPFPSFSLKSSGSSRVRLYGFDQIPHVLRDFLHTPHGVFKFIGPGADREIPLLLIGGRVLVKLQTGGVVHTGIQSPSQVVQHLSKLEREWQNPVRLRGRDEEFPCPIVVYLGDRSVNVVCIKTIPDFCESLSVRFCPRGTVPARLEW
jgi:hypothetical protein